jgi:carbon-monoxide dehydrogenase medium subunit
MTANGHTDDEPEFYAPETVAAATRRLAETDGSATVVAGGQSLTLLLRQGFVEPDALLDVTRVQSMSGVSLDGHRIDLGATTTYADLVDHEVSSTVAMLEEACSVVGDRQVRQMGTVGGAVCHADPALDIVAPLLALEANVTLVSESTERTLPLEEFFVGHMQTARDKNELLSSIEGHLPTTPQWGSAYEKHARVEGGWATVGVGTLVGLSDGTIDDARIALTAVGNSAVRASAAEAELTGEVVSESAIDAASKAVTDDIDPIDDLSGSAAYKVQLAQTLTERSLSNAIERAGGAV